MKPEATDFLTRRYGRWVTRRVAVAGIVIVWLLAALISFVPISLGLHRADEEAPILNEDGQEVRVADPNF